MTRVIQQIFSGKTFTVIREDDQWLVLRPIPDDYGPDMRIAQSSFAAKWRNVKGKPAPPKPLALDDPGTIESELAIAGAWPLPRKRGRPKGSKNKPREAST